MTGPALQPGPGVPAYGEAGGRWPIAPGDVLEIGPHRLACADLESSTYDRVWRFFPAYQTVYSDPPWNAGNCANFRRKAGDARQVDFGHFMGRIIRQCTRPGVAVIWLEMGREHAAGLAAILGRITGWPVQEWDTVYYRRHPAKLLRCAAERSALDLTGMDDEKTPALALAEAAKGSVVFDPCTGQGLTPVTADRLGLRAIGTELNPRRLSVTVDRLIHQSGYRFRKIGRL